MSVKRCRIGKKHQLRLAVDSATNNSANRNCCFLPIRQRFTDIQPP